ncbi:MAG TPA: heme o synthase [Anaeromyxobacteraceae bacterium]|nr:heme o synthase [Anaeromyxobacteraceae bacterium]
MRAVASTIPAPARSSAVQIALDLVALGKPRLSALVLSTAAGGMYLAPGPRDTASAVALLLGTAAVVSAANALNNYVERDSDRLMRRTRNRPLPAGRLEPWVALAMGLGLPAIALPAIAWYTNNLTASLAALALTSYACVYTPMKRTSSLALFVGAVPGAIPPLMGWTAVTGSLDPGGLALFAILFVWQLPHFLAISLYLSDDYARGGLRVFALVHGARATQIASAVTSAVLVPTSLLLVPLGVAGPVYGGVALALGLGLFGWSLSGLGREAPTQRWARNFFLGTLAYLTLLFGALFFSAR